jgi:glycosyltransferase involved in cell wall biosynthesis
MKIGFDAKRLFKNHTGLGNYSRTLLRNLALYYPEFQYTLYTTGVGESEETANFLDNPAFRIIEPTGSFKALWRSYGVAKQLSSDGIDLYHGLSHEIPLNISRSGVRSIVTIHDLIFKVYPHTYSYLDRQIYDFKIRNSCKQADHIVAISEHTKRDIVKYYGISPDKITVVYQSISPLFFEQTPTLGGRAELDKLDIPSEYFLYVGTVQERKCLDLIIRAYPLLRPEERLPLVVVGGRTSYEQKVNQSIEAAGISDKVIRFERLTDNKVLKSLYEHATALVYPSQYEGFGLPVAEAMLCKTPVITTTVSSLPEAGGPDSLLVPPDNVEELANAMQRVINDSALRKTMVENGDIYARKHFGAEAATRSMMAVYDKVLRQHK